MCSLVRDAREIVTSVGNSWIICRSKSFAGRIYYFNTFTGEAVWNLSETEVERAKHRTRLLQNQPGFALEDCPEPLESPTNDSASGKQPSVNINQPSHCIVANHFPKSATLYTSPQYNRSNPTNPIPFQIPVAPALHPAAWNIASQQIFVTPINGPPQPLISNNNFDHLYVNNMSNTLSDRFKRYSEIPQKQPGAGYVNKNNMKYNKYQHKSPKKYHSNKYNNNLKNKIDLRLLLSLKKKENLIREKESLLMASEGFNIYSKYLDNHTQQHSVSPASIRRTYNFNVNEEEEEQVKNNDENWLEKFNYKHSDIDQGGNIAHPSLIRRRSYSFSANAREENDEDNEQIPHLNSKCGDTNQNVSPHSSFKQRKIYGFSANEEGRNDDEDNYGDTYEGDVNRLPSSRRRRSYSFSANEAENDNGENYCISNQVVSILPSSRRRRSYSCTADDDGRNDEDNYWLSNQDDVSPLPSYSRSCSLNLNEKDNKEKDNTMWIKENKSQEDKNPFERKTLRNLLQTKESSDVLYIVPDSNVFLKNINLLNNVLLITEKNFRLLVPQMVINKIETQTKSCSRALAYKALYFIWQQHEANLAIIVESNEENERANSDILHFCRQIIDQNRRVFLLTDDIELYNIADASNVPIVTTAKMEQLINEYKSNETTTKNMYDVSKLANVKIVIPNDDETMKSPMSKNINPERGLNEERSANLLHTNDFIQIDKKACDIGVQADSISLTKVTDDIRDDIILPNSTKANDYSSSNIGEMRLKKYNLSHELSSKIKNTVGNKITLNRRTPKSTFSLSNDQVKAGNSVASSSPATDSTINETASSNNENLTWGLSSLTSAESLYKNCVEGSSTDNIMYRNVYQPENIMEENSNSIISNTASNVDTESEQSGAQKASTRKVAAEDRCVMFEVEDARMETTLRMQSEEWVSRLVQIMEEALTQLLQRESDFALESMPPPWTLHEAAECVKKHFHHDADVVDAADKLLQVSRDNGGLRGKIKSNISPHKYMELYSYGVYLIDALQGVLNGNEDLQTAAASMAKLYEDIQHPHLDPSNQDSFGDIDVHECEDNVTEEKDKSKAKVNQGDINKDIKKPSPKKNKEVQSPGKYNLRSKTKKNIEVHQETSDKTSDNGLFNRTIDSESSFFSSLYLKKISTSNSETETEKSQPLIILETSDNKPENSQSVQETDKHINTIEETTAQILKGDPIMNEPKIIRTFSKCLEFEEKLKNKTGLLGDSDVSWTYDDEEPGLTIDEEQLTSDYGYQDYMDNEYYENLNEGLWYTGNLPEENVLNSTLQVPKDINSANKTVTINHLMEKLESHILNAYTSIQNFCVRSSESLTSEDLSADDLSRMQARAEKTSTYINKICERLQSVLTRENSQNSIFHLLKNKEFADVSVEDGDMENYRHYINNCLEQGNILKESSELLIKACRLKARA